MPGRFDFFYDLAPVLIEPTTTIPLTFERTETVYNPLTGVSVPTDTTADILGTPPLQWTEDELRDDTLRKSDLKIIVASKTVDASGLDLRPGTESKVYCTRQGERFQVIPVKRVASGDKEAILILGLRK